MTNPSGLPDPLTEAPSKEGNPTAGRFSNRLFESNDEIRQVAKTLAEHGGGAVAFDLALDLVLNEIVEQARSATGATGAAIALTRDGEMVCRATTGGNAPDLGVRVESESGLSGACLKTREVQNCSDTETDQRVNAEACRQLGVRSMLIAPIGSAEECFGILEVLSTYANAFGEKDVKLLCELTERVAKNKKEADEGMEGARLSQEDPTPGEGQAGEQELEAVDLAPAEAINSKSDIWSTVLVVLVILTAISLGLVVGLRSARNGVRGSTNTAPSSPPAAGRNQGSSPVPDQESAAVERSSNPSPKAEGVSEPKKPRSETPVEAGGLVVTENGRVIYRVPPAQIAPASNASASDSPNSRLVHRVQPEYPPEAKAQHIQGTVILNVQVLGDGRVGDIDIIKGDPLLSEAAVNAVKQWTYRPYSIGGQPVDSQTRVTIKFTLPPA